ncbi:unnamed protein product, partial [Mesorhabditis spiculigera]
MHRRTQIKALKSAFLRIWTGKIAFLRFFIVWALPHAINLPFFTAGRGDAGPDPIGEFRTMKGNDAAVAFANDFLFYIFFQLCLRGTRWYVIPWNGPVFGTFAIYGWTTWRNILFLGHIPFALNRISLYLWPGSYGNIWSKKAVLVCLLVQWAVPVALQAEKAVGSGAKTSMQICSILQAIPMFAEFVRTLISFLLLYVFKTDQYDADSWVVKFWSEILYYYIDTSVTIQPYCLLITNTHVRKLFLCRKRNNVIKGSSVLWAI